MASKALFFLLLVTFSLLENTEASWKFWKKDKPEETTTTTTTTTVKPVINNPQPGVNKVTSGNTNRGIAGAADAALAVGVGDTSTNIRSNARPQRPNPGTEVGQDLPGSKPKNPGIGGGTGQGYRDWAVDLTGAGEPGRPALALPNQGPALSPGNRQVPNSGIPQQPGNRQSLPASPSAVPQQPGNRQSLPASPSAVPQQPGNRQSLPATPTPVPRPASAPVPRPASPQPGNPGQQTSTLNVGAITPAPTGGKTWAQVASGGSKPSSPTPAPVNGQGGVRVSPGAAAAGAVGAAAVGPGAFARDPIYSKGNTVTDDDLAKLSESLWIKDKNNAWQHIRLNLQKQTSSSSPKDEAPQPLLTVNPQALQIPTIAKVLTIYDNYNPDTRTNEYISPAQRNEESLLIDTFLSTNVMSAAMRFLADKGLMKKDYYEYKDTLRRMWFNLYSRGEGKIGSTGFEHVFLTETKLGTEVSGLHNWIYFNSEEVKKRADYLGYIKKLDLGDKAAILKLHAKFNNIDKPVTTMFIGTSPELEMSLYTVCFFTRPEQPCPVSLGGTKFNIITHKFKYRGYDLIGSAYPDI